MISAVPSCCHWLLPAEVIKQMLFTLSLWIFVWNIHLSVVLLGRMCIKKKISFWLDWRTYWMCFWVNPRLWECFWIKALASPKKIDLNWQFHDRNQLYSLPLKKAKTDNFEQCVGVRGCSRKQLWKSLNNQTRRAWKMTVCKPTVYPDVCQVRTGNNPVDSWAVGMAASRLHLWDFPLV